MVFSCSGIFYLCFESLGLDITSVIFNRFKMAATYLLWFLSIEKSDERLIPVRYTFILIEIVLSIPIKFPFLFETLWILSISILKIYLRSCSNLLIGTNPRSLPLRNESILSARAPSCTIYIQPNKMGGVLVEQNKLCRAKSTFIPI